MKTIALTGHPTAQEAAVLQLEALLVERGMQNEIRLRAGLTERAEAHGIHDQGGEIWHCGPETQRRELIGHIDRVLPATTFDGMGIHVITCLAEFIAKTHISGANHG